MSVLADALSQAMAESPNNLVILDRDSAEWIRYPWAEVHARGQSVAARLLDAGIAGDVGLVGEPTVEFVAALHGAWLAGRAISILPGPVRGADVRQWAQSTAARFLGVGVTTVFSHGDTLEQLRGPEQLAVLDLPAVARVRDTTVAPQSTDRPAVLQGTAGSTGTPRTAMLSPEAVLDNVGGLLQHTGVDPRTDVGCSWLPLYHDMGLSFLLSGALSGSDMWLAPTAAFAASPFRWLNWLSESRATMTAGPNFAYNVLGKYARRVSDIDLSALRFALNGGEPIDCDGFATFMTEMARFGLDPGAASPSYGLAESTCAVTAPTPGTGLRYDEIHDNNTDSPRKHAMLGTPVPGMEIRVTPNEHNALNVPGREVGQIEIRGTSMMSGYLGDAPLEPGTWFATGDLGYLSDGGLVVCGRVKELITVAGRNVFPVEVERVAAQIRGVREGAVVAVGAGGNAVRPGLVITAEFRGPDEDGARSELVQRVASECGVVPADVVFVAPGTLPRTSSGKLRRLEVKQKLEMARQ